MFGKKFYTFSMEAQIRVCERKLSYYEEVCRNTRDVITWLRMKLEISEKNTKKPLKGMPIKTRSTELIDSLPMLGTEEELVSEVCLRYS